jgi:SWIM zinc finger
VGLIPRFKRVRVVTLNNNNEGLCSCFYFERFGIPCRHVLHVFCKVSVLEYEPGLRDVCIRWHNRYRQYAFTEAASANDKHIQETIEETLQCQVRGPKLPDADIITLDISHNNEIPDEFQVKPAWLSCTYSPATCRAALSLFCVQTAEDAFYNPPAGLCSITQTSQTGPDSPARVFEVVPLVAHKTKYGSFATFRSMFDEFYKEIENDQDECMIFEQYLTANLARIRGKHKRRKNDNTSRAVSSNVAIETKKISKNAGKFN